MNPVIDDLFIGRAPLVFILGPCVFEEKSRNRKIASGIATVAARLGVPWVFKASFDKANRSSAGSFRGPGLDEGLAELAAIKAEFGVPVTTDVHLPEQAAVVAEVADILQVPAFLCRQTDLLLACAETGRPVNVKKGQFMAPEDMAGVLGKLRRGRAMLTERGTSFGYNDLVVDFRGLVRMRALGVPVCMDVTHAVQRPGGGATSGGERHFVPALARAAAAVGIDAMFAEVHDDPPNARSDAATQWPLDQLEPLLRAVLAIRAAAS